MSTLFKKNLLIISALSSIFLLSVISCKKDKVSPKKNSINELPPATTIGAQTFGCYVNGKLWLPPQNGFSIMGDYSKGMIMMNAKKDPTNTTPFESVIIGYIFNKNVTDTGKYVLNSKGLVGRFQRGFQIFDTNDSIGGYIHITRLDSVKFILSGTFAYSAQPKTGSQEIVKIDSGRFDLKYIL